MSAKQTVPSEAAQVSLVNLIVLLATFIFGAALGGFLARFVAPASDLALFVGVGIFPAILLAGGYLVEELWFLRLWERQPRWQLEIDDPSASPAVHADRRRAAVFLPFGVIVGAFGGLVVGLLHASAPLWASLLLYTLAGLGYGGIVYSLVQFSLLPRLGHGAG
jgi:hypothetical protein